MQPIEILLVEDDLADIRLTKRSLDESQVANGLHVVRDGVEAMKFLRREEQYADMPRPDLILLDLNMPRKDGRETLSEIKNDPELKTIPVVILTTSNREADIARSYQEHANCYITKPVDLDSFRHVVHSIKDFWLAVVKLPPCQRV